MKKNSVELASYAHYYLKIEELSLSKQLNDEEFDNYLLKIAKWCINNRNTEFANYDEIKEKLDKEVRIK